MKALSWVSGTELSLLSGDAREISMVSPEGFRERGVIGVLARLSGERCKGIKFKPTINEL